MTRCTSQGCTARPPRLLIVPGLHDSGPAHWQTWLQRLYRHSVRVVQHDWADPDLERWSATIAATLERAGPGPWIVAAHSFGCLALAHHLARPDQQSGHGLISAALLVAPAEPLKFHVAERLPQQRLPLLSMVVASDSDPWMSADSARLWAQRWGSHWTNLGDVGHINAEAGFGPLPLARRWLLAVEHRLMREQRAARQAPPPPTWRFAV